MVQKIEQKIKQFNEQAVARWFEKLYRRRGLKSMREYPAFPIFLDYLAVQPGKRLLDIGCGLGWLLRAARKRGLEAYGIDLSPAAVKWSARNAPGAVVKVSSVTRMDFPDKYFDYLTCIGVLEHFIDIPTAIREMYRVSTDCARFCFMVPNSRTVSWQIGGRFRQRTRGIRENALSLRKWQRLFRESGLAVEGVFRDEWPIHKTVALPGVGRLQKIVGMGRRFIRRMVPLHFANHFVFVLRKIAPDQ